jgi:hypothetical protein
VVESPSKGIESTLVLFRDVPGKVLGLWVTTEHLVLLLVVPIIRASNEQDGRVLA